MRSELMRWAARTDDLDGARTREVTSVAFKESTLKGLQSHYTTSSIFKDCPKAEWGRFRVAVHSVLITRTFEYFIGFLLIADIVCICLEVNDKAKSHAQQTVASSVFVGIDLAFQIAFSIEISLRIFVQRRGYIRNKWEIIDCIIVMVAWVHFIITRLPDYATDLPDTKRLRILRIFRLSRAVRIMVKFPELHNMIKSFANSMMAMVWGFVMIVLLLILCAVVSVEILHDQQENIDYPDGAWCGEAFTSVFKAFLMFFQNLVAGDSWGHCAIPVIQAHPGMMIIFIGALLFIQLGFTNLILSSIVEAASINRQEDLEELATKRKKDEMECLNRFYDVIRSIDVDKKGSLTIQEFIEGYENCKEMRFLLSMLNIDPTDVTQLFSFMDSDGSETVTYDEFMMCLKKAETQDIRMQMMGLKLQLSHISGEISGELEDLFSRLSQRLDVIELPEKPGVVARESSRAPVSTAKRVERTRRRQTPRSAQSLLMRTPEESFPNIASVTCAGRHSVEKNEEMMHCVDSHIADDLPRHLDYKNRHWGSRGRSGVEGNDEEAISDPCHRDGAFWDKMGKDARDHSAADAPPTASVEPRRSQVSNCALKAMGRTLSRKPNGTSATPQPPNKSSSPTSKRGEATSVLATSLKASDRYENHEGPRIQGEPPQLCFGKRASIGDGDSVSSDEWQEDI